MPSLGFLIFGFLLVSCSPESTPSTMLDSGAISDGSITALDAAADGTVTASDAAIPDATSAQCNWPITLGMGQSEGRWSAVFTLSDDGDCDLIEDTNPGFEGYALLFSDEIDNLISGNFYMHVIYPWELEISDIDCTVEQQGRVVNCSPDEAEFQMVTGIRNSVDNRLVLIETTLDHDAHELTVSHVLFL